MAGVCVRNSTCSILSSRLTFTLCSIDWASTSAVLSIYQNLIYSLHRPRILIQALQNWSNSSTHSVVYWNREGVVGPHRGPNREVHISTGCCAHGRFVDTPVFTRQFYQTKLTTDLQYCLGVLNTNSNVESLYLRCTKNTCFVSFYKIHKLSEEFEFTY